MPLPVDLRSVAHGPILTGAGSLVSLSMEPNALPVVGQGRACVVYDLGDGTVLRRYRNPFPSAKQEADAMRRAAQAGVPVPAVHAADATGIRMDRVDGPTMATTLSQQPSQAVRFGVLLADLHRRLDATGAARPGQAALVHGDLHPGNVLMSAAGPVIIDWTNHRIGPRSLDVALTWLVLACFQPDDKTLQARLTPTRAPLLRGFLDTIDIRSAAASLNDAAAIRHADQATTPSEHARIDRLLVDAAARL
jgi:aminoglycoside phosphotransferase (APT) family kinase protein